MSRSVIIKNIENPRNKLITLNGWLYSPEWIRPYESLWSIIQTIKYVNMISDKDICNIFRISGNVNQYYSDKISMYGRINVSPSDIRGILKIPEEHFDAMERVSILNESEDFISDRVRICPVCMQKYGYHSYFHQFRGINNCPWHGTELIDKDMLYGIWSRKTLCYDLDLKDYPYSIPLPSLRETEDMYQPSYFKDIKSLFIVKNNKNESNVDLSWVEKEGFHGNLIFSRETDPAEKYVLILKMLEEKLNEKDERLLVYFDRLDNGLNSGLDITYYYDRNYFCHCFIQEIINKFTKDTSDTTIESFFSFYKNEAADPYYAALTFACNITGTDYIWNALSKHYYLHPQSPTYNMFFQNTKTIFYYPYTDACLPRMNMGNRRTGYRSFQLCVGFEVQWTFLNDIWSQYLSMLGKGYTYSELSSHIVYPSYLIMEKENGDLYMKKVGGTKPD